ncbi:phosphodiester glycosidase family protein [Yinghuangia soli]|uniref:Phosphodiester glycosidase family protein n=1 Tax=Yinghuangia soli TaxID=2908204 RepID=A0AA41Q0B6_9ACTN|nr:phosphodiester glycosidase family protein [Yinghuangia soli]MCF2528971.1 phosphodiester glycosidase family protein [Yinghuangia soli]
MHTSIRISLPLALVASTFAVGSPSAGAASAASAASAAGIETIAPGVAYRTFTFDTPRGDARIHEVAVGMRAGGPRVGLLYPGTVAARDTVSRMTGRQGAVAGINGDFFHMDESQHAGVPVTGAPSGPAVDGGNPLKGPVPLAQRYGPRPPQGEGPEHVFGVDTGGTARLDRLTVRGTIGTPNGPLDVSGLNQYALPVGSVGVFTSQWGTPSRARAVCGSDSSRAAACAADVAEVTVRDGKVQGVAAEPGDGAIPTGTTVLLGRDAGAHALRGLAPGTPVDVAYDLASASGARYAFALGAYPLIRGGSPVAGLEPGGPAPRSAVCIRSNGHGLKLLATDGRGGKSPGLTLPELAAALKPLGCTDAAYLDGGGSVTLAARGSDKGRIAVRNTLDGGKERPVANGIAVFG